MNSMCMACAWHVQAICKACAGYVGAGAGQVQGRCSAGAGQVQGMRRAFEINWLCLAERTEEFSLFLFI